MSKPYKIEIVDGRDYVSTNDAKRILGAASAKDLRALGSATVTIGKGKTLWSVDWLIDRAKRIRNSDNYKPDTSWIKEYQSKRDDGNDRSANTKVPLPPSAPQESNLTGTSRLDELKRLMPPPNELPCRGVAWEAVESVIGVTYPESFKNFIAVYGALQWFDWLQPLVPLENMSPERFRAYLESIFRDNLGGDIVDRSGKLLLVPKFGMPGCWLPFMAGSDGDVYAWHTDGPSESWRVVCVVNRRARVLPAVSITEMLVGWLNGEPPMEQVWGSIDDFRKHSQERFSMLR